MWPPGSEEIVAWAECSVVASFICAACCWNGVPVKGIWKARGQALGIAYLPFELVSAVVLLWSLELITIWVVARSSFKASTVGTISVFDTVVLHVLGAAHVADSLGSSGSAVLVEEFGELNVVGGVREASLSESMGIGPPSCEELVVWAECGSVARFEGVVSAKATMHVKVVTELREETDGESNFVLVLASTVPLSGCVVVGRVDIIGDTSCETSREGSFIVIDAVFAHPDLSSHVADALGCAVSGVLAEESGELFVVRWKSTRLSEHVVLVSSELNGGRESGESESDSEFHFCFVKGLFKFLLILIKKGAFKYTFDPNHTVKTGREHTGKVNTVRNWSIPVNS